MAVNTIPNVYWPTLSILNLLKLMNVEKAFSVYTVHWTVYTVTVHSTLKYIYSQYWVLVLKVYKNKKMLMWNAEMVPKNVVRLIK